MYNYPGESPLSHVRHSLSREFRELGKLCAEQSLNLRQIFWHVEERGSALCILILSLPFIFPVPLPGVSTPFGLLIVSLSISMLVGRAPYLPASWLDRPLPREATVKFVDYASRLFARTETMFRPRMQWVLDNILLRLSSILILLLSGLLLALPLPPVTNAPPAAAIVLTSIGLLEKDGLALLTGFLMFGLNLLFFTALFVLGYDAIGHLVRLTFSR